MSKTRPLPYSKEELNELKAIKKVPNREKKAALKAFSEKYGRGFGGVNSRYYATIGPSKKKTEKVSKPIKKNTNVSKSVSAGKKSWETRKAKRKSKRKFHNPPTEGKDLSISRNQLRFPYKTIAIEGSEVVVTF